VLVSSTQISVALRSQLSQFPESSRVPVLLPSASASPRDNLSTTCLPRIGPPHWITSPAPFKTMNLTSSQSEIEEVWRRGVTDMTQRIRRPSRKSRPSCARSIRLRSDITWLSQGSRRAISLSRELHRARQLRPSREDERIAAIIRFPPELFKARRRRR
jgi:hypothetical protein